MTPMQRIDNELKARGMSWTALRAALDVKQRQSVTNWRREGLPSKHYSAVDDFFGKPYGWTELGLESAEKNHDSLDNNPERLKTILANVAAQFRLIPEADWGDALVDVTATLLKRSQLR